MEETKRRDDEKRLYIWMSENGFIIATRHYKHGVLFGVNTQQFSFVDCFMGGVVRTEEFDEYSFYLTTGGGLRKITSPLPKVNF